MQQQPTDPVKVFVSKYLSKGPEQFYNSIIYHSLSGLSEDNKEYNPAIELLDYYEVFLKLYRREGNQVNLDLSILFRKASHKVYRVLLKKKLIETNLRFLNVVA